MQISKEQIDQLYLFTRQHYVEWYDLQTELVDHLANAIETEWQQNPTISFEDALNKEFKKFGIYGFIDVIEKKQKALRKRYNRFVWQHFKEFFTLPKIVITFLSTGLLFMILSYTVYSRSIMIGLTVVFVIAIFYQVMKLHLARKKKLKSGEKIWLLEETIYRCGNFGSFISFPINCMMMSLKHFSADELNDAVLLGISFVLVSVGIVYFIIFHIIPSKAEEYLEATYPEYQLVKV